MLTTALLVGLFAPTQSLFASNSVSGVANGSDTSTDNSQLAPGEGVRRWLDLNTLSLSFRYRNQLASDGYRYFDNGQQRSLIDGRFKFDVQGKYAVHFHLSSGRTFNWGYTDEIGPDFLERVPAATSYFPPAVLQRLFAAIYADPVQFAMDAHVPSRGWELYFRQLYFSATPIKQISLEYGSLGIERGEGTEATTYDDDGYIAGERLRIFDPKHLFFDQVALTWAYEGDIQHPNFFERGGRLGQSNYHQFLAAKHFGSRLKTSVDYTFDKGTHTLREAALLKIPEAKVLDSVRPELYQRLNDRALNGETFRAHQGLAVTATKTFVHQFQLDAGVAHIDQDYGVLTGDRIADVVGFSMNGDSFLTGTRAFVRANWKVSPYASFFGYYTHALTEPPIAVFDLNKQSFNAGATIDFKSLLTTRFHIL